MYVCMYVCMYTSVYNCDCLADISFFFFLFAFLSIFSLFFLSFTYYSSNVLGTFHGKSEGINQRFQCHTEKRDNPPWINTSIISPLLDFGSELMIQLSLTSIMISVPKNFYEKWRFCFVSISIQREKTML